MAQTGAVSDQTAPAAITGVGPIGLTVSDLDRSVRFFTDVLTFQEIRRAEHFGPDFERLYGLADATARTATLRLGDEQIELTQYQTPAGRPMPPDSRSNDRWFQHIAIIVRDMDAAYARLQAHGVQPASAGGPQTLPAWNRSAAGVRAYYFRDPDGHFLEILQFPTGKGDPKWHKYRELGTGIGERGRAEDDPAAGPLFLGIDHTAIVVADTDASLTFYRDTLGMKVVGGSENYGPEQERLNNVPGARLRITTLRAPSGPGIELLEYVSPRDGRPYPADASTSDLLHWQTTVVSPHAIGARDGIVRDPDGHALRVTQR